MCFSVEVIIEATCIVLCIGYTVYISMELLT